MLDVLLESRGVRRPRPVVEAMISAAAHAALIAFVVVVPVLDNPFEQHKTKDELTPPVYLVPPDKSGPPQEEHLQFMAVGGKGTERDQTGEAVKPEHESSAATRDERTVVALPRAQLVDDAYSVLDVDSAAVRDPSSAAPAYPPAMLNLHIEGAATVRFVVDTTGLVDLTTVRTLNTTNPAFEHAVIEALPRMKFRAARLGSVPVRQTESQEFKFQLKNLASVRP